jgi:hypothetical protein
MREGRGVYRVLVGRPECKRPLGRPRCRWEDNIKIYLREIGIDGATGFGWLRIGSSGRLLWTSSSTIKKAGYCLTSWMILGFAKIILYHVVSK